MSTKLPKYDGPRIQLVLGKFRISRVIKTPVGWDLLTILNGTPLIINAPPFADVHEGDVLTIYTEVAHGKPS